ncbi:hypothetical protein HZH68_004066 [Vespula germanica]|uniref:Ketosynthase family 3 (KS3) domain-containing protein n=1 Tax=Vespula germanica TaxID=30212 RepID=A0A834NHW0_VESGE|nr:hypothetical protein HZH68_004066 [Vespula germanica]
MVVQSISYWLDVIGLLYNVDTGCSSSLYAMEYTYRDIHSGALLETFYKKYGVPTTCISYVEAHGTGTRVGDPEELNYIDHIFTKNRANPLKVEFVKSNIGHTEPANGICSIAKAIISMEFGIIPPNINLNRPRKDVKALILLVSMYTHAFGDTHLLLKLNPKIKIKNELPDDDLPRLVTVSGRIVEAVKTILNEIDNRPIDIEFIRLFHDIHKKAIPGHFYRGYMITDMKQSDTKIWDIEKFSDTKKPICFVFPGMDSQWPGMCKTLMKFPRFTKVIEKCDTVLKPRKLHIYQILTRIDNSILDNTLHSFVGIVAVQIGLVDLLTSVGILPDYIIGYPVGELGCVYADESLIVKETILVAYSQGISVIETNTSHYSVAIVGFGYEDLRDLCPNNINSRHFKDVLLSWMGTFQRLVHNEIQYAGEACFRRMNCSNSIQQEFKCVKGHMIDSRNLFPGTGYLCLVWETLGVKIDNLYADMFVITENVKFN